MKKENAIYNNDFLNNILEEEYQTMTNNFQSQFNGEDNMDSPVKTAEILAELRAIYRLMYDNMDSITLEPKDSLLDNKLKSRRLELLKNL